MSAVQRVGSGGSMIVRTGILMGVGPIGPEGKRGLPGDQGGTGNEGPVGPMGAVTELISAQTIGATQSLGPNSLVNISFGTVQRDDEGLFTSATNIVLQPDAIYAFNGFVQFEKPANAGNGYRRLELFEDADTDTILDLDIVPAVTDGPTVCKINAVVVGLSGATYRVRARHTDDLAVAVATGRLTVNRIGPGVQGIPGPAGGEGPVGPPGPPGEKGDDGDANSGFSSFDEL